MEEGAISEKKEKNSDLYLRPKKKIPIPIKKVIIICMCAFTSSIPRALMQLLCCAAVHA